MADVIRNTGPAIFYASAAAGPIALTTIAIGSLMSGRPVAVGPPADALASLVVGAGVLSAVAMLIALIPNIVGVSIMARLASWHVGFRHQAIWALAGGAASGVPAWIMVDPDPGQRLVAFWTATGAMSALVGRWCVWWEQCSAA